MSLVSQQILQTGLARMYYTNPMKSSQLMEKITVALPFLLKLLYLIYNYISNQ